MLRIEFERDETAAGRQRPAQPDRAVAGERADLEDAARALDAGEQVQELALRRGHTDRGQAGRPARLLRGIEHGVRGQEQIRDVVVDGGPGLGRHDVLRKGYLMR